MAWTTPKTNWVLSDRFNIGDYNRIKNNLQYLIDETLAMCRPFPYTPMGADLTDYTGHRTAAQFNAFEQNLEAINQAGFTQDYGTTQTFFANGAFIKYDELNRIESACLSIKGYLDNMRAGVVDKRLAYILGQYKEVKP